MANNPDFLSALRENYLTIQSLYNFQDMDHKNMPPCFKKEFFESLGYDEKDFTLHHESTTKTNISVIAQPKEATTKKKVSKEKFKKLVSSPVSRGRLALLGCPQKTTEGKSDEELRRMVLEKVSLDAKGLIEVLCGGTVELKGFLIYYGVPGKDFIGKSREDLEKMFIQKVGLDEVISAIDEIKNQEKISGKKYNHKYENSLEAMRLERGKSLIENEEFKGLRTEQEIREYFSGFSISALEDAQRYYSMKKSLEKSASDVAHAMS